MPLAVCACMCGSSDSLVRNFLKSAGYQDWANISIVKGKDRSRALLNSLPPAPELQMLDNFLKDSSKWAVIIGYNGNMCRWSDIAHGGVKSKIEAEFLVKQFA